MTLDEVAVMFDVEIRTVTKWKNEFGMQQAAPGFYKRDDVVKWRVQYLEKKIKLLQQGGVDGVSASTKVKQVKYERDQLKLLQEQRLLVNIDEIIPIITDQLSNLRTNSATYGQRVSPLVEGMSVNERAIVLQDKLNELFAKLSGVPDTLKRIGSSIERPASESVQRVKSAPKNKNKRTRNRKKNTKPRVKSRTRSVSR
jgi:transposase